MKNKEKIQLFLFGCTLTGMGLAAVYSLKNKENKNQNLNLSRLEQFAEQDSIKGLSIVEEADMYKMCRVGHKSKDYNLTSEDIQNGIKAYESKINKGEYKNEK